MDDRPSLNEIMRQASVFPLEEALASEHFIEHHAEGPDVGALVYSLVLGPPFER
jgi:hypothetical protein